MNEWISVEDRLPSGLPARDYMAYRPEAPYDGRVCSLRYCSMYNGWSGKYKVTHWMPLPPPPENK